MKVYARLAVPANFQQLAPAVLEGPEYLPALPVKSSVCRLSSSLILTARGAAESLLKRVI